jgi:hypothetical protein
VTERVIDVVPGLVRGHKRDGRSIYALEASAKAAAQWVTGGCTYAKIGHLHDHVCRDVDH